MGERNKESVEEIMARYERDRQTRRESGKKYLLSLIPALKAAGIAYMFGFYDGEGDSGTVTSVKFFKADAAPTDAHNEWDTGDGENAPDGIAPDSDALQDAIFDITPPGFEINDGSYGAVVLDVEAGKVRLNHANRIADVEYADEDEV